MIRQKQTCYFFSIPMDLVNNNHITKHWVFIFVHCVYSGIMAKEVNTNKFKEFNIRNCSIIELGVSICELCRNGKILSIIYKDFFLNVYYYGYSKWILITKKRLDGYLCGIHDSYATHNKEHKHISQNVFTKQRIMQGIFV